MVGKVRFSLISGPASAMLAVSLSQEEGPTMGDAQDAGKTVPLPSASHSSDAEPVKTFIAPVAEPENSTAEVATSHSNPSDTVPIDDSGGFAETGIFAPQSGPSSTLIGPGDQDRDQSPDRTLDIGGGSSG